MPELRITSWNLEWLAKLLDRLANPPGPGAPAAQRRVHRDATIRLDAIRREIIEIDADVLCILEGPPAADAITDFCAGPLGGSYRPVTLPSGDYQQRGRQWIWFLVKPALMSSARLLEPAEWQSYTATEFAARFGPGTSYGKTWPVHKWGEFRSSRHSHYRHPQVMRLDWQGETIEFVGAHLKSKFVRLRHYRPETPDDPKHQAFVRKAVEARIKLATEAQDIRYYLGRRFAQEAHPAIFVMGDFNDGPGKELFERQFLYFDLVSNLQGDVFFARKFLNHALFDYLDDLRWSVFFRDPIDPARDPHILLDHILFTQGLVNGALPIEVRPGAGKVEHEIHDRINATLSARQRTSDHKPVSCVISGR